MGVAPDVVLEPYATHKNVDLVVFFEKQSLGKGETLIWSRSDAIADSLVVHHQIHSGRHAGRRSRTPRREAEGIDASDWHLENSRTRKFMALPILVLSTSYIRIVFGLT